MFSNFSDDTEPTFKQGLTSFVKSSWINLLTIVVPFGIMSHFFWSPTVTFVLNFISIIPLAKMLGYVTEDISLRTGEVIGGLLNATFGNAVELIISVIALTQNLLVVVQASMLGSILSNLLLILGMSFMGGGFKFKEQRFNVTVAQTSSSLLFISVSSLLIPAAFYSTSRDFIGATEINKIILTISRSIAIILLVIYFSYLFFQLKTHNHLFLESSQENVYRAHHYSQQFIHDREANVPVRVFTENEKIEFPQMPIWMSILLLLLITLMISVCAESLVSAIEIVIEEWHISQTFIGLIILPIVGNAAEHVTAVTVAMKNKMDLALSVAIGSSIQIALFVTPVMVLVGWALNVNMSLYFNIYETVILFVTVLMVNYLIMDGKSNWLEGLMLCSIYTIIAVSFYYYPDNTSTLK
ncbi:Sodium/calcium exchanger protein-domain-containing protein [Spinellus fusiger]|nr:Sodium/calcium exchanger protein-domain-containing protein [Spinellus fusiger]